MRCECDRSLAEKLREYENQWNVQNHRRWGTPAFDPEKYCTLPAGGESEVFGTYAEDGNYQESGFNGPTGGSEMERASGGDVSAARPDVSYTYFLQFFEHSHVNINFKGVSGGASGTSPNRVVASAPIYGEIVGCCGRAPNLHYFRKGQKCCPDGEVVDGKAPCGVDFL